MEPDEGALRQEIVKACRVLYRCGVADLAGHLSVRLGDGRVLVKPRRVSWLTATVDDLVVIDGEGHRAGAAPDEKLPLQEWPIHVAIYQARPDVQAVLHAHPPDSTLVATTDLPLRPLTRELAQLMDDIAVFDDPRDNNSLIDRFEEGQQLARMLGNSKRVVLLKAHGCVAVGESIGDVCVTAYMLERAAQSLLKAAAAAPTAQRADQDQVGAANNRSPAVMRQLVAERWAVLQTYFPS